MSLGPAEMDLRIGTVLTVRVIFEEFPAGTMEFRCIRCDCVTSRLMANSSMANSSAQIDALSAAVEHELMHWRETLEAMTRGIQ